MRRRFPAVPIAEKTCLPGSLLNQLRLKPLPACFIKWRKSPFSLFAQKQTTFRHSRRWHNRQGVPAKATPCATLIKAGRQRNNPSSCAVASRLATTKQIHFRALARLFIEAITPVLPVTASPDIAHPRIFRQTRRKATLPQPGNGGTSVRRRPLQTTAY